MSGDDTPTILQDNLARRRDSARRDAYETRRRVDERVDGHRGPEVVRRVAMAVVAGMTVVGVQVSTRRPGGVLAGPCC